MLSLKNNNNSNYKESKKRKNKGLSIKRLIKLLLVLINLEIKFNKTIKIRNNLKKTEDNLNIVSQPNKNTIVSTSNRIIMVNKLKNKIDNF